MMWNKKINLNEKNNLNILIRIHNSRYASRKNVEFHDTRTNRKLQVPKLNKILVRC